MAASSSCALLNDNVDADAIVAIRRDRTMAADEAVTVISIIPCTFFIFPYDDKVVL
jgi:hypothetical protein